MKFERNKQKEFQKNCEESIFEIRNMQNQA